MSQPRYTEEQLNWLQEQIIERNIMYAINGRVPHGFEIREDIERLRKTMPDK